MIKCQEHNMAEHTSEFKNQSILDKKLEQNTRELLDNPPIIT
jgi:hypothetical protein